MSSYEGRHRSAQSQASSLARSHQPATGRANPSEAQTAPSETPTATALALNMSESLRTRAESRPAPRRRSRWLSRPVLAAGLAVGLGASALGLAAAKDLSPVDAVFVVGDGVRAQTDELARADAVDTSYRAAASVSRNERRAAIAATGLADAAQVEAKAKAELAKTKAAADAAAKKKAATDAAAKEKARAAAERAAVINNAKSNPQAAARLLMADHGWTSDAQYNCLVNLWNGESDWRWSAENSSSGAYGIPQSLPASKMATFGADYRTNPITQMKWGLWYIDQSYGSPCNAWSFWQNKSPHWY